MQVGVRVGDEGRRHRTARRVIQAKTDAAYADLAAAVAELRAEGLSLRAVAARLNAEDHTTRTGKQGTAQIPAEICSKEIDL